MFKTRRAARTSVSVAGILLFGLAVFLISYTLLHADTLPTSIDSIMAHLNHSVRHWHVLVIGLLPVYVALLFFGTALATLSSVELAYRWFKRLF